MNTQATIEDVLAELLKSGEARIANFGVFKVNTLPEREARNPATGDKIIVPPKKVVKFAPFGALKEAVNR